MLKVLIKKQLLELFQNYFINRKTGNIKNKKEVITFILLAGFLFIFLGITFFNISKDVAKVTLSLNLDWLYFSVVACIALTLGLFVSIFSTYSSLYLPKDNELILSLPIPTYKIVLSRVIGVYAVSFLYTSWAWIPSIISYFSIVDFSLVKVIIPIVLTFILPGFVTFLSCILGFFVALVASKTKGNNFLKIFLSILIIFVYYIVYFNMSNKLNSISSYIGEVSSTVKSYFHYIYLFSNAACGDVLSLILVLLVTAFLIFICIFIITKTFTKLSILKENNRQSKNTNIKINKNSKEKALLMREYKHFVSVPTWVLNGGFGLLVMVVLSVVLVVKSDSLLSILDSFPPELSSYMDVLPALVLIFICMFISANTILPVSISIEGKTLWLLKSLPIDTYRIFKSKEKMFVQMNICAVIPLLFVLFYILKLSFLELTLIFIGAYLFCNLIGDFGLYLNLKNPNFNWNNESSLTKRSISVVISLFGGWAFCIVLGYIALSLSDIPVMCILILFIIIFFVIWYLLHRYLKTKGVILFKEL